MSEHVGENAELYPLGLLEPGDVRALEAHVADCAECSARVARASAVAFSLTAPLPAVEPRLKSPSRSPARTTQLVAWLAAAALLVVAIGLARQNLALRSGAADRATIVATLVHSHFKHVEMAAPSGQKLAAKVLYARDGSWIFVIVDGAPGSLHLFGRATAAFRDLGALQTAAGTASLLVRTDRPLRQVELRAAGATLGTATLLY
ncbi:MAG TPA: hypothetical protein VMF61_03250 [Candidatus Acidoferrales bacterium]|nr:hypothetical protein [Candidatus Acidoferrales bacterium]